MVAKTHPTITLGEYLRRMTCKACGGKPKSAVVKDWPVDGAHSIGQAATWAVEMIEKLSVSG